MWGMQVVRKSLAVLSRTNREGLIEGRHANKDLEVLKEEALRVPGGGGAQAKRKSKEDRKPLCGAFLKFANTMSLLHVCVHECVCA